MGAYYTFTCKGCGYEAEVSGGKDRGISASIQTLICKDCSIFVDVLVGHYDRDVRTRKEIFIPETGKCPECSGSNLEEWKTDSLCPKCSGEMERGEMFAIWD
jgi:hypothetical protein